MSSPILRAATRSLLPLMLVVATIILLRGHNAPGGGFVGGLIAAAAFALHAMAFGPAATRALLRVDLVTVVGAGLLLGILSGFVGSFSGAPYFTGAWTTIVIPLGTPLFFDLGVFLVVAGAVTLLVLSLLED